MKSRKKWIVSLIVYSLFIAVMCARWYHPTYVKADVGVQPVLPGGSNIQPEEKTLIRMSSEVVKINVRAATEADNNLIALNPKAYGYNVIKIWYPGVMEVNAEFRMANPAANTVNMTVWFPLASALENADWNINPEETVPYITDFKVYADGKALEISVSELPNPKGIDKPDLPWASFQGNFAGNSETILTVHYTLPLQPSTKGNEMALYYVFQTGASWAGTIGRAELIINLPYPASTGTMAGIQPGHFYLPYMSTTNQSSTLPSGTELEGNQVRWVWIDFEPGPEDDFAIWLLQPEKWQTLADALAAVKSTPQNGQAWLNLASAYHILAVTPGNSPTIFSGSYLDPGKEAYQKVIDLLPESPAGHAGLALLTLAPYMAEKNAPVEVIEMVKEEFRIAVELESANPVIENNESITQWLPGWLEEALATYAYNSATATAEFSIWSTEQTELTAQTVMQTASAEKTSTKSKLPATLTPSPVPAEEKPSPDSVDQILLIAGGVVLLAVLIYMRSRKS